MFSVSVNRSYVIYNIGLHSFVHAVRRCWSSWQARCVAHSVKQTSGRKKAIEINRMMEKVFVSGTNTYGQLIRSPIGYCRLPNASRWILAGKRGKKRAASVVMHNSWHSSIGGGKRPSMYWGKVESNVHRKLGISLVQAFHFHRPFNSFKLTSDLILRRTGKIVDDEDDNVNRYHLHVRFAPRWDSQSSGREIIFLFFSSISILLCLRRFIRQRRSWLFQKCTGKTIPAKCYT